MYDVVIVDGNNLANKAFYVNNFMSCDVNGETYKTGILYGMISMLLGVCKQTLLTDESRVFCVWDAPGGSDYRNDISEDYKATRKPVTEEERIAKNEFYNQLDFAKRELLSLRMYQTEKQGYEADDIIYTLTKSILKKTKNKNILIVSEDKDFRSLISDRVKLYSISKTLVWDTEYFVGEIGIPKPEYFTDYLALAGDASDNYSGLPGIGDSTARKILNDNVFLEISGSPVERILKTPKLIDWLELSERYKNILKENKDLLSLNYELAKFRNVPDLMLRRNKNSSFSKAVTMLEKYRMKSLLSPVNKNVLHYLV